MPQTGHQFYAAHGTGRPLLLLHGHTLDHRMWDGLLPYLTPHCQVITPDLAGHGKSGISPDGAPLADDLAALLQHLGLERAAVCGLSMGGAAAISFAIHHPQLCAALIPVDSALFGYRFPSWPGPGPYVRQARSEGLAPALERWLADPLFAPALASPAAEQVRRIVREFPGALWLKPSPPPFSVDEPGLLGTIQAPTLVMMGEADLPDFHQLADLLAGAIPGARRAMIGDAGHLCPMEQPETFASVLRAFLETIPGA